MLAIENIKEFLQQPHIAVVGVSRKGDIPANHIYQKMKAEGYDVKPVNPNAEEVEGDPCYPDLESLPEKPEAVMLASTPGVSLKMVQQCIDNQVALVWMHQGIGKGSYSRRAEKKLEASGIKVISRGCPMMFLGKVDWFHKMLKWFK